jgi:hypothetical protein
LLQNVLYIYNYFLIKTGLKDYAQKFFGSEPVSEETLFELPTANRN